MLTLSTSGNLIIHTKNNISSIDLYHGNLSFLMDDYDKNEKIFPLRVLKGYMYKDISGLEQ